MYPNSSGQLLQSLLSLNVLSCIRLLATHAIHVVFVLYHSQFRMGTGRLMTGFVTVSSLCSVNILMHFMCSFIWYL